MSDRGRETSCALSEIRTVLNRARTARENIATTPETAPGFWRETDRRRINSRTGDFYDPPRYYVEWVSTGPAEFDPDQAAMLAALDDFINAASRWTRTGRPLKERP